MSDGEIDYGQYTREQLLRMLPRINQEKFPLSYANACRELRKKWPEAPEDLSEALAARTAPMHMAMPPQALVEGTRRFSVRFSPPQGSMAGGPSPNNMKLSGAGTVDVSPVAVSFSYGLDGPISTDCTIKLVDVANVGYSAAENAVAIRTRNDDRHAVVWMENIADAQALMALLPKVTTPEFLEQLAREAKFREHLHAISPQAPVTPSIIGLNIIVFLIMLLAGAGLTATNPSVHLKFGSNFGPLTWTGEPWRLLTSAFIHFGVIHIAFNMYALYNGGVLTERLYGSARFTVIYLLSAIAGSVVSGWWDPLRNSAGASGAIFGVYGALLVFFALRRSDIPTALLKSAGRGAISLCVYSLVIGATNPLIDNACHVGGLLGGAAAGFLLVRPFDPTVRAVPQPWRLAGASLAVCAALALLSAPLLLPNGARSANLRLDRALENFTEQESQLVDRFVAIESSLQAGKLTGASAADRIETEVMRPWSKVTQSLRALPPIEPADSIAAQRLVATQEYAMAREQANALTVSALRNPAPAADEAMVASWNRVGDLVEAAKKLDTGKR